MTPHITIKSFLENNGIEVLLDLNKNSDPIDSPDEFGKKNGYDDIYEGVYNNIQGLGLNQVTIASVNHQFDRSAQGMYITLALNKEQDIKECIVMNVDYFGGSWIKYGLSFPQGESKDVLDFLKNNSFMTQNYDFLESIFAKTVNPSSEKELVGRARIETEERSGYVRKSFSKKGHPTDMIVAYGKTEYGYSLDTRFKINEDNKLKVFEAVNEMRAIFNSFQDKIN